MIISAVTICAYERQIAIVATSISFSVAIWLFAHLWQTKCNNNASRYDAAYSQRGYMFSLNCEQLYFNRKCDCHGAVIYNFKVNCLVYHFKVNFLNMNSKHHMNGFSKN